MRNECLDFTGKKENFMVACNLYYNMKKKYKSSWIRWEMGDK